MDNRAIGIFDSGVGGLVVVEELHGLLRSENIIYFGDTKRVPYGNLTCSEITKNSLEICDFLISQNVKAIVIACNTISVTCGDILAKNYNVPILSITESGVFSAVETAKDSIGLLATNATVKSKAHENLIHKKSPNLKFYAKACPLFVNIVEEGFMNTVVAYETAVIYLKDLQNIDTLLLGCTHFSLIREDIKKAIDEKVKIVDPSRNVAFVLKKLLEDKEMLNNSKVEGNIKFYQSGAKEKFDFIAKEVLKMDVDSILHVL